MAEDSKANAVRTFLVDLRHRTKLTRLGEEERFYPKGAASRHTYSPSAKCTFVPMAARGLLDQHGGMSLTDAHHGHRARAARRGPSQRHGQLPAPRGWRDVEIGSAFYSTGPLVIYLSAALLVVGAVWLLALYPTLWMLLLAVVMHGVASTAVLAVVAALLKED